MTNEEAIKTIKSHCYFSNLVPVGKEALDMAIKALEQEPKSDGDCISRQAVIDLAEWFDLNLQHFSVANLIDEVENMPPANPQKQKTGHWVDGFCSECGEEAITEWNEVGGKLCLSNYCPNCGAKMESEERG